MTPAEFKKDPLLRMTVLIERLRAGWPWDETLLEDAVDHGRMFRTTFRRERVWAHISFWFTTTPERITFRIQAETLSGDRREVHLTTYLSILAAFGELPGCTLLEMVS